MTGEAGGVALLLVAVAALAARDGPDEYEWRDLRRTQAALWLVTAVTLGYVTVVEDASLASLTLPPVAPFLDAVLTAWVLVGGTAVAVALAVRAGGWDRVGSAVRTLVSLSPARTLAVAVSAGVTEEVVFRGYLVTRVVALTGSEVAAVVVSAAAFLALHAPSRGRRRLAQLAPVGVALAVAFVVTGNLLAVVVVHASYDALTLLTTDVEDLPAS